MQKCISAHKEYLKKNLQNEIKKEKLNSKFFLHPKPKLHTDFTYKNHTKATVLKIWTDNMLGCHGVCFSSDFHHVKVSEGKSLFAKIEFLNAHNQPINHFC